MPGVYRRSRRQAVRGPLAEARDLLVSGPVCILSYTEIETGTEDCCRRVGILKTKCSTAPFLAIRKAVPDRSIK